MAQSEEGSTAPWVKARMASLGALMTLAKLAAGTEGTLSDEAFTCSDSSRRHRTAFVAYHPWRERLQKDGGKSFIVGGP